MSEEPEADLRQEILDSAKRMLSQLDRIEISQEREIHSDLTEKPREFLTMLSTLKTEQSASILEDVTKWGEQRREKFDKFEEPLLKQVEDNQSLTEAATDSTLRMTCQMDGFKDKLSQAKGQIASMSESVARAGQDMMKARLAGNVLASGTERDIPHLQLESNPEALLPDLLEMKSKDEELIKRMKAREEHFMAAVNSLSGEVEELSKDMVDAKTEILNLQSENERLRGVINGMQEKAQLVVKPLMKMDIVRSVALVATGSLAFEVACSDSAAGVDVGGAAEERLKAPVMAMRTIEFFSTDIPPEDVDVSGPGGSQRRARQWGRTGPDGSATKEIKAENEEVDGEVSFEIKEDESGKKRVEVSEKGAKALAGKSPEFLEQLENEVQTDIQQIIGMNAAGITGGDVSALQAQQKENEDRIKEQENRIKEQENKMKEQEEELEDLRRLLIEQAELLKKHGIQGPDISAVLNRGARGNRGKKGKSVGADGDGQDSGDDNGFSVVEPTGAAAAGGRRRFDKERESANESTNIDDEDAGDLKGGGRTGRRRVNSPTDNETNDPNDPLSAGGRGVHGGRGGKESRDDDTDEKGAQGSGSTMRGDGKRTRGLDENTEQNRGEHEESLGTGSGKRDLGDEEGVHRMGKSGHGAGRSGESGNDSEYGYGREIRGTGRGLGASGRGFGDSDRGLSENGQSPGAAGYGYSQDGSARGMMLPLGIRQKANNDGFRLIYRDHNDAVVVDADYRPEELHGLYVIGKAIKITLPPVRIRGGFSRKFIKTCQDPNVSIRLNPLIKLEKDSTTPTTDFLAAHEARMQRISNLRRNLAGLLQNESASPTANIVDCPHRREPWMWTSFPVRPPPPITRIYTQQHQRGGEPVSKSVRGLLANRKPAITKLPATRRKSPAARTARIPVTTAHVRLSNDLTLTPR